MEYGSLSWLLRLTGLVTVARKPPSFVASCMITWCLRTFFSEQLYDTYTWWLQTYKEGAAECCLYNGPLPAPDCALAAPGAPSEADFQGRPGLGPGNFAAAFFELFVSLFAVIEDYTWKREL